jgi:multicomponent Na+:H+ antiporter subunit E
MAETSSQPGAAAQGGQEKRQGPRRIDHVGRALSLAVILFITWLLLSGHYEAFVVTLGVLSCLVIVFIAVRMDVLDREALPVHLTWSVVPYWLWLFKEIWVAAIDVTKVILSPKLSISPRMVQFTSTQKSELGQVIYANSITLTPGTFTIRVFDDQLLVHALTQEGVDGLATGEMDRRVTKLEGPA